VTDPNSRRTPAIEVERLVKVDPGDVRAVDDIEPRQRAIRRLTA
jgi:hypothetical protein